MTRFQLGDVRITVLSAGSIWLDGGAMFGVVPRVLWEPRRPPDDKNRIRLAMNVMLVEDGQRRILVDTGGGDKSDAKTRAIYRMENVSPRELLGPTGLEPDEIDLVINTHLHFDHVGGNTVLGTDGVLRPAFPNAQYVVQAGELSTARMDNERTRASYVAANFEPLAAEEDRVRLVEGETRIGDHLILSVAPGHTPHMQIVRVATGEGTLAFLADLVPTAMHLRYPFIMAYDMEPMVTLATKKRVLPQAVAEGWRVVFQHDDRMPLATLEAGERGGLSPRAWETEG